MSVDFITLVKDRYSVRGYEDTPVEDDKLNYVLECARQAPSACNRQPWHFFIVRSDEARAAVIRSYDREWFRKAPLYIIVAVDPDSAWVRPEDTYNHAPVDGSIAAEHICLAAAAVGLGSCWVCNFDPVTLKEAIGAESPWVPLAILPLGYPAADPRPTTRKPIDEITTIL